MVPLTVVVFTVALAEVVSTSVLTCALILSEVARQTAPATITSQVAFTFIVFLLVAVLLLGFVFVMQTNGDKIISGSPVGPVFQCRQMNARRGEVLKR